LRRETDGFSALNRWGIRVINGIEDHVAGRWLHGLESILLGHSSMYWHEHFFFLIKNKKENEGIESHLL